MLELTDSSSQLGLVIFFYIVPNLRLLLFGGIVADRVDIRLLLISSQAIVTIVILVIATLVISSLVAF